MIIVYIILNKSTLFAFCDKYCKKLFKFTVCSVSREDKRWFSENEGKNLPETRKWSASWLVMEKTEANKVLVHIWKKNMSLNNSPGDRWCPRSSSNKPLSCSNAARWSSDKPWSVCQSVGNLHMHCKPSLKNLGRETMFRWFTLSIQIDGKNDLRDVRHACLQICSTQQQRSWWSISHTFLQDDSRVIWFGHLLKDCEWKLQFRRTRELANKHILGAPLKHVRLCFLVVTLKLEQTMQQPMQSVWNKTNHLSISSTGSRAVAAPEP